MSDWDRAVLAWGDRIFYPVKAVFRLVGLELNPVQIYMLLVGLFFLVLLRNSAVGPWTLLRPKRSATGTVTAIEDTGEAVYATIRFADSAGREWSVSTNVPTQASRVGDIVPISYEAANPRRAFEQGQIFRRLITATAFYGVVAFCFAVAFGFVNFDVGN